MHAMAVTATNPGPTMVRAEKVWMGCCMAAQAGGVELLRGHPVQLQDLGGISARGNVRLARAMAALAGNSLTGMQQSQLGMRIRGELGRKRSVAESAGGRAGKFARLDRRSRGARRYGHGRLRSFGRRSRRGLLLLRRLTLLRGAYGRCLPKPRKHRERNKKYKQAAH